MPNSRWDSDFWKAIAALSAILVIIVSLLTILQWFGRVDVYTLLILPIIKFFNLSVPVYSIPLAFLVVVGGFLMILYIDDKLHPRPTSNNISNPLAGADILDTECYRYVAHLGKTPQTADFLKEKYQEFRDRYGLSGGYSSEELLKELEERDLLVFQNGKWEVTQKALAYIAKYHGGK
ncbi:MAG: hypothetical protein ABR909_07785 [Candidatus Bathyarchaeia archaeon]|jgi:hypothetical protein